MLVNAHTAVSTSRVLLVPYEAHHVPAYHEWMKSPEIQEETASEPLSLDEEYSMQKSWRTDVDKLTFIACLPLDSRASATSDEIKGGGQSDGTERMIGDVNLFLTPADEDDEGCIGELELMIAPTEQRRQGYGRATILAFMQYIQLHLDDILKEYSGVRGSEGELEEEDQGKMKLLQLKVKIGGKNQKSINLFESIGFIKVGEGPNYFGEVELCFEGFLGKERTTALLGQWGIQDYREVKYSL